MNHFEHSTIKTGIEIEHPSPTRIVVLAVALAFVVGALLGWSMSYFTFILSVAK